MEEDPSNSTVEGFTEKALECLPNQHQAKDIIDLMKIASFEKDISELKALLDQNKTNLQRLKMNPAYRKSGPAGAEIREQASIGEFDIQRKEETIRRWEEEVKKLKDGIQMPSGDQPAAQQQSPPAAQQKPAIQSTSFQRKQKPGPKGSHSDTLRRRADIKAVAKKVGKKRGWETNACMQLKAMKTPLPSKTLKDIYGNDWPAWLRTNRKAFLKQWSKDVNSN
jgi:hypothetical protein